MGAKPQDHKSKKRPARPEEPFDFVTDDGQTITLKAPATLHVGFARKHRDLPPMSQLFAMIEALADGDALDVIDDMDKKQFARFQTELYEHQGIELGE